MFCVPFTTCVWFHGPELEANKRGATTTYPSLAEQDRPWGHQLNKTSDHCRGEQQQGKKKDHYDAIKRALPKKRAPIKSVFDFGNVHKLNNPQT